MCLTAGLGRTKRYNAATLRQDAILIALYWPILVANILPRKWCASTLGFVSSFVGVPFALHLLGVSSVMAGNRLG